MRFSRLLHAHILICALSISAIASPFDDAFDTFDEESIDAPKQGQGAQGEIRRAPRCLAPLEKRTGDPARDRLRQKASDQNSELRKQITLYFIDALTGAGIRSAEVTFEGERGRTERGGRVCFTYPSGDLMDTTLKAQFERPGYVSLDAELRFMAGALFFNRFSVSKALPPGKLRVVLDWGAQPRDLDAHLIREGAYHISYRETRSYQDQVLLDRDDLDGFGPETITINQLSSQGEYRYFVRDFTRSGRLADSKAHVRVYSERRLLKSYVIPSDIKGDEWEVFRVTHGQLR